MQLTLLGTGNPRPNPHRAGPSQQLLVGGTSVLVDCGTGAARRMVEAGLNPAEVEYLFFTHLHSDHTVDLYHMLVSGWLLGRKRPLVVLGPAGTREFVERVLHAFEFDMRVRRLSDRYPSELLEITTREVADGDVLEGDGWRATAIEVEHVVVKPALGFHFEDDRHRLVISGDTAPCRAVIEAAAGADLLVHELNGATPDRDPHTAAAEAIPPWDEVRNGSHTCAHQVGQIAAEANVPTLVVSHLPPRADETWIHETVRPHYRGQIVVGQDLMTF